MSYAELVKALRCCATMTCKGDECKYMILGCHDCWQKLHDDAAAAIEALQAAQPHWVSVEHEQPEDLKVVIIHKAWDGEITLGYRYPFGGELKLWMCLKTPYDQYEVPWVGAGHVDYWMPLPEPPQEDA